jgi:hypothetical protein
MGESGEYEALAIGGLDGLLDEAELNWPLFDAHGEIEVWAEFARDFCAEGNFGVGAGGDGDAMDFSAVCGDDFLAVGSEGVIGKEVASEEGFLVVALDRIFQPVLFTTFEVADAEAGFGFGAGGVDEEIAVGRNFGAHGAAGRVGDGVFVAGDQIAADDLGERESHIVEAFGIFAGGVIEKMAVFGERGAEGVEPLAGRSVGLGVGLGDLNAGAALDVIHPELRGADGELREAGGDDVVAVGSPGRRGELALFVLAELFGIRAVGVGDPDVFGAAAITEESDFLAVGGKARLRVEAHAGGEFAGFAAGDGHRVEIADQFEDEGFTVGRDVEGKPGAFGGFEFDVA